MRRGRKAEVHAHLRRWRRSNFLKSMSTSGSRNGDSEPKPPGDVRNPIGTGHEVVDDLYRREAEHSIDFSGPVIPWEWINKLKTRQARTYWNAVMVLGDIVFHYRSNAHRDTKDGLYKLKKRFKHDWYHLNVGDLCERLGVVPEVISRIVRLLERRKIVKRHYERSHGGFCYQTNLFVELNLDELTKLTRPPARPESQLAPDQKVNLGGTCKSIYPPSESQSAHDQKVNRTKKTITRTTPSRSEGTTTNNNKETAAPRGGDVCEPSAQDQGTTCPEGPVDAFPELEDQDISGLSTQDVNRARNILRNLKQRWKEFYQTEREPELPVSFTKSTVNALDELGCQTQDLVHAISASWILAENYPNPPKEGYDRTFWSRRCCKKLSRLFERDKKHGMLAVQHIKDEEVRSRERTVDEVKRWWFEHVTNIEEEP